MRFEIGDLFRSLTDTRDFAYFLGRLSKSLIGASDTVPQFRLLKRNEITAVFAGKLCFVVKPWHRFLRFMAGSRTGRIDVGIVEKRHDQTPEITEPHA